MAIFMHIIVRLAKNYIVLFLKKSIIFTAVSINDALLFSVHLAMPPLECPDCKHKMVFLELYFNHQRISLEELYEKSMSKSRGKRSSS